MHPSLCGYHPPKDHLLSNSDNIILIFNIDLEMGTAIARCAFSGEIGGTGAERFFYGAEFSDGGSGGTLCAPDTINEILNVNLMSKHTQIVRRFWFGDIHERAPPPAHLS